jgi:hypothetical protein
MQDILRGTFVGESGSFASLAQASEGRSGRSRVLPRVGGTDAWLGAREAEVGAQRAGARLEHDLENSTDLVPPRDFKSQSQAWKVLIPRYFLKSGRQDLNLRPPGPQPGALPDCATPRGCYPEPTRSRALRAGDGNRTRPRSLEGSCATTTPRPQAGLHVTGALLQSDALLSRPAPLCAPPSAPPPPRLPAPAAARGRTSCRGRRRA